MVNPIWQIDLLYSGENWYSGVFEVADYESSLKILKGIFDVIRILNAPAKKTCFED